jgi:hypothetical protein
LYADTYQNILLPSATTTAYLCLWLALCQVTFNRICFLSLSILQRQSDLHSSIQNKSKVLLSDKHFINITFYKSLSRKFLSLCSVHTMYCNYIKKCRLIIYPMLLSIASHFGVTIFDLVWYWNSISILFLYLNLDHNIRIAIESRRWCSDLSSVVFLYVFWHVICSTQYFHSTFLSQISHDLLELQTINVIE